MGVAFVEARVDTELMATLPRGTVTLLFTDIEGSTHLLQRLGRERYGYALQSHRELIRAAADHHGGQEVEMQGDSFLLAFHRGRDAVLCAAEIQRQFAAGDPQSMRVRIGIHTGEPDLTAENLYLGIDVHRAARLMDAAHGGQVLLSQQTRQLVEAELPEGLTLEPLGQFKLRSLVEPESISQLIIAGTPSRFPGPRATPVQPSRGRLARWASVGLATAAVVAVASAYFASHSRGTPIIAVPNSVAVIDPKTNRVVAVTAVGTEPTRIVEGDGAVWTLNTGEQTISRVDASTRQRTRTFSAGTVASDIAFAGGAIWVADAATDNVAVLDESGGVQASIPLGIRHRRQEFVTPRVVLTSHAGTVWATGGDLTTVAISSRTRRVLRQMPGFPDVNADRSPAGPDIAAGAAGVWATDGRDELFRLDGGQADSVTLGGLGGDEGIGGLSVGRDAVWAAGAGVVWQILARTARPVKTYEVGAGTKGVLIAADSVWTTNAFDGTVSRVDTTSGETTTITVGGTPNGLALANGFVWVTID